MPALCPEDDGCAVDMVAHKHWDCNGFRVSSQKVNKEPENTGRQVPPQTEKRTHRGYTDGFESQQICRDAAQTEAKNLRGRESENCRIWNIEFDVDFFTRVGYTDIRNRGATGKRSVPLQCYRSNRVLGGRAVTSFLFQKKTKEFERTGIRELKNQNSIPRNLNFWSVRGMCPLFQFHRRN